MISCWRVYNTILGCILIFGKPEKEDSVSAGHSNVVWLIEEIGGNRCSRRRTWTKLGVTYSAPTWALPQYSLSRMLLMGPMLRHYLCSWEGKLELSWVAGVLWSPNDGVDTTVSQLFHNIYWVSACAWYSSGHWACNNKRGRQAPCAQGVYIQGRDRQWNK